ncbi:Hypothetical protein CINCED_3A002654 [Cinara cedri]|uniref:Uncharacterized protein n=1 Tax=Cinara cedri TaxID=506608 RepID=A0A5E4N1M0_9HEMI|nr:Hypothetical protein CINCED_3A002654 [Cinara cedri]
MYLPYNYYTIRVLIFFSVWFSPPFPHETPRTKRVPIAQTHPSPATARRPITRDGSVGDPNLNKLNDRHSRVHRHKFTPRNSVCFLMYVFRHNYCTRLSGCACEKNRGREKSRVQENVRRRGEITFPYVTDARLIRTNRCLLLQSVKVLYSSKTRTVFSRGRGPFNT